MIIIIRCYGYASINYVATFGNVSPKASNQGRRTYKHYHYNNKGNYFHDLHFSFLSLPKSPIELSLKNNWLEITEVISYYILRMLKNKDLPPWLSLLLWQQDQNSNG
jgi:hypothetical protein